MLQKCNEIFWKLRSSGLGQDRAKSIREGNSPLIHSQCQDKSYLIILVNSQKINLCLFVVMKSCIQNHLLYSVFTGKKKAVTLPSCLEVCICLVYDLNYNNDIKLESHCEK